MNLLDKSVLLLLLLLGYNKSYTQAAEEHGIQLFPLQFNQTLQAASKGHLLSDMAVAFNPLATRRNEGDTLDLPFFDDFTSSQVYPDMRLWVDSHVYVNSNFPVSPPSYGVATFDQLDKSGKPYTDNFSQNVFRAWDTLTSRPINLKTYQVGITEVNYQLSDSIYLSFFYQGGGLGDRPEIQDSLVLQFRKNNGQWVSVWSIFGIGSNPFRQVLAGVQDEDFLWEAFQFRFLHYTFAMGNLNHVHLDYVRMNRNRSANDTLVRDVAINKKPWSLLKNYYAMPYAHYQADSANQKANDHTIGVRNNDVDVINTQFQFEAYHKTSQLALFPFSGSSRNIFAHSDTSESFNSFGFGALPNNEYVHIRNVYKINPQAGNTTPSSYNSLGNNDEFVRFQDFKNYYAYDDGTAEGGIGLSYEGLPPGRGSFAVKYTLTKPDTLAGLAVFFNRSLESVISRQFTLCVWRGISEGGMEDKPIYELPVLAPVYTDSINGFHHFVFDTTLVLPAGDFYVGWYQIAVYNLNVGYDNNYRLNGQEQRNTNILYNMLGMWQYADASIKGTPMIRPLIGEYSKWGMSVPEEPKHFSHAKPFSVFPNPNQGVFEIKCINTGNPDGTYRVITTEGREVAQGNLHNTQRVDISALPSGVYLLEIRNQQTIQTEKIIKQ